MPYVPAVQPTLTTDEQAVEARAFKSLMDILCDDPGLAACGVKKIVTYSSGRDEGELEKTDPPPSELPYLRVTLLSCMSAPETEVSHAVDMDVRFRGYTEGRSETDILNFMGRIRRALKPVTPTLLAAARATMDQPGIIGTKISAQAGAMGTIGVAEHGLRADFVLKVKLLART